MAADAQGARPRDTGLQWAMVAVAIIAMIIVHASHGLPFNWDDQGQYLSHARALLEGRGYSDIGFIYTAYNNYIGPVAEPPGLPLLIAPALAISGPDLLPVRGVLLLSLCVFLWLAWRFVAPLAGTWTAAAVVVMMVAVFSSTHALDGIMADVPFCAAIWGVIVAADIEGPLSRRRLAVMAIAGAIAFTFRMAALGLLPAIALLALTRPRREWPGLCVVALVWVAAAALVMFGLPTSSALITETARGGGEVFDDVHANMRAMLFGVLDAFLYPFSSNLANDVWHVLAIALASVGTWQLRRSRARFASLFAISYIAMLMVIPTNASRYWWPLVPLQCLVLAQGLTSLTARMAAPRWLPAMALALLLALGLLRDVREPAIPFARRDDVIAVVAALRNASPTEPPRVAAYSPRLLTWHTRIPAMGHFAATPDQVLAELRDKKIAFLVRGSLGERPVLDAVMERAVAERPDGYEMLGTYGSFTLFRVRP